jgi:DNA-binding NtrC family response regulator
MVLRKFGFEVIQAGSAADALRILDEHPIDLVLTDLLMPRVDGAELARLVKEKLPALPVAIISGVNEVPSAASVADVFISKLEGHETLRDRLLELLQRRANTPTET